MIPITEYAKNSMVPKRILRYLHRVGKIQDPLSNTDLVGIHFLEEIWGNKELLRAQLNRLSLKARLNFLQTANLSTKWERYAYSRFYNLAPGSKLPMHMLIEEIQTTFCFQLNKQKINRLYTIRNRAQVAKHRERKRVGHC